MQILYLYDIKARNKREFNRVKRSFYYHLNKLALKRSSFRTKSALLIDGTKEQLLDAFFKRFGNKVEVYKVVAKSVEMF
ncbi:TPA: hypothetical protein HA238_00165 [Candidatus Micrarchaeota archaeon]|nr:hypothetical protein [Candidatus Micrarchaeota archaeon]